MNGICLLAWFEAISLAKTLVSAERQVSSFLNGVNQTSSSSNGCSSIERKVGLLDKVEMAAPSLTLIRRLKLGKLLVGIA